MFHDKSFHSNFYISESDISMSTKKEFYPQIKNVKFFICSARAYDFD